LKAYHSNRPFQNSRQGKQHAGIVFRKTGKRREDAVFIGLLIQKGDEFNPQKIFSDQKIVKITTIDGNHLVK